MKKYKLINLFFLFALIMWGPFGYSSTGVENAVVELAAQISNSMVKTSKKKIAVVELTSIKDESTIFGQFFAEELVTQLFLVSPGRFEVVERQQLSKILREQKLGADGLLDPKAMERIGKLLGVDAIVSGTYTDLGDNIKINARLISVDTASIFAVASTNVPKVGMVVSLLSDAEQGVPKKGLQSRSGSLSSVSSDSIGPKKVVKNNGMIFKLLDMERTSSGLLFHLTVMSDVDTRLYIHMLSRRPRAIDSEGNEYLGDKANIGSKNITLDGVSRLVSNIPVKVNFHIKGIPRSVTKLALFEMQVSIGNEWREIQILDLELPN